MISRTILSVALALLPITAVAQGQQQAPPDPQLVEAQLRFDLGRAMMEAGQFQAKAAQLTKALTEAQAKIAAMEKAQKPVDTPAPPVKK